MPRTRNTIQELLPVRPVRLSHETSSEVLPPEAVTRDIVGAKAFGLSTLPPNWTLPFFVISKELLAQYINCHSDRQRVVKAWLNQIIESLILEGMDEKDLIILRSSSIHEGMQNRGQLSSALGSVSNLAQVLYRYLAELSSPSLVPSLTSGGIPLILQKYPTKLLGKGHLSNERRLNKEPRDFSGSFEKEKHKEIPFQINLRKWRQHTRFENYRDSRLLCRITTEVSEVLKIPASWAESMLQRVHFEWAWDGEFIYIVQADKVNATNGIDPLKMFPVRGTAITKFEPQFLKTISKDHANKFEKVRNIFTYAELDLPTAPLFVLDDIDEIRNLSEGRISPELFNDLEHLVKTSLIIRTDLSKISKLHRQMLDQVQVDNALEAFKWLKEKSSALLNGPTCTGAELAFLFHNFIPSISSAFAYAAPGKRIVQIEALWGLPEGLYYNGHDKIIVDTKSLNLSQAMMQRIEVRATNHYKGFLVSPNPDNTWTTKDIRPPYDWRPAISKSDWIKEIAVQSRRISEREGTPLSIMWFVGVPKHVCRTGIFPWHHEHVDITSVSLSRIHRSKTPFDKTFTVKTAYDLAVLNSADTNELQNIRTIKIQPIGDDILRDKEALRKIGEAAKKIDAIIYLEGGILSHAYYQLIQTGAAVQVANSFNAKHGEREFNKVVRDKIPLNIQAGGEEVRTKQLKADELVKALREKLVEETYEVLDAGYQDAIIEELADVQEVIYGLLKSMGVSNKAVQSVRRQKKQSPEVSRTELSC